MSGRLLPRRSETDTAVVSRDQSCLIRKPHVDPSHVSLRSRPTGAVRFSCRSPVGAVAGLLCFRRRASPNGCM